MEHKKEPQEHMRLDLPSGAPPVTVHKVKASDLFGDNGKIFMENVGCGCGKKGKHAHN